MKRMYLASILPQKFLTKLARRFDTPGAFEGAVEGSSFWMDASYLRWCMFDRVKTAAKRFL